MQTWWRFAVPEARIQFSIKELIAQGATLKQRFHTLDQLAEMTPREQLAAATDFAEYEWFKEIDKAEFAFHDLQMIVELASTDLDYWELARKIAQENRDELTNEQKVLLFDALAAEKPKGRASVPVKNRRVMRLRSIAKVLRDHYGFALTRNDATEHECAASIFEKLGIEGENGKSLSEATLKEYLEGLA